MDKLVTELMSRSGLTESTLQGMVSQKDFKI